MKHSILYFILAFIFFSCQNDGTIEAKAIAVPLVSAKTDTGTISVADTTSGNTNARLITNTKPLLIARGSEPGWYAEFFADHIRLLVDNGKDSLIDENDFSDINNDFTYENIMVQDGSDKKHKSFSLSIKIENKSCVEEGSGEKREKSIVVIYNKKRYTGCATAK